MMILTEEQAAHLANKVLKYLDTDEETKDFDQGHLTMVLGTAIFFLGHSAGLQSGIKILEGKEDDKNLSSH